MGVPTTWFDAHPTRAQGAILKKLALVEADHTKDTHEIDSHKAYRAAGPAASSAHLTHVHPPA